MNELGISEIDALALGSAVLGSGGGGNPRLGALLLRQAMEKRNLRSIEVTPFSEIRDSDFVICSASMGSPVIGIEKIPNGEEYARAFRGLERHLGRKASHISSVEIGGMNSLVPFVTSVSTGLPVADGDGEGRAFPELQMTTFSALGCRASPMCITDERGNSAVLGCVDDLWTERIARSITIVFGGRGYIALYPMSGRSYRRSAIPGSLTRALRIGEALIDGIAAKEAEKRLRDACGARRIFGGKIMDLKRLDTRGFAIGHVVVEGTDERKGESLRILFQNEYLLARKTTGSGEIAAQTPNIISIHDQTTLMPITTDKLRYGMRCAIFAIPVDKKWRIKNAKKIVGPQAFDLR